MMEDPPPKLTHGAQKYEGDGAGRLTLSGISADVTPKHYQLTFVIPNDTASTFTCEEQIDVTVSRANISVIILHGYALTVKSLCYKCEEGEGNDKREATSLRCLECRFRDDETVQIHFDKPLPVGNGRIHIKLEGAITNNFTGLFRYPPKLPVVAGQPDKVSYNFATQMEPCFARRVFFCWDEPEIKATFQVSLVIPDNWAPISNTPVIDVADAGVFASSAETNVDLAAITFDRTPVMSTYLLAIVAGSFDFVEAQTLELEEEITCRVCTPIGQSNLGAFGLDVTMKAIAYFANYFETFPFAKLDIVPIPGLISGSMENLGLILLDEKFLLTHDANSSSFAKQLATLVLCHEIAHQWFGNMVTIRHMDLWFKEALTSFLEYSCADHIHPKLEYGLHFATNIRAKALPLDAAEGSVPIYAQNGHSHNDDEHSEKDSKSTSVGKFSTLSYLKGICVIHMFNSYITPQVFRNAVLKYVESNSYKSSTAAEFWQTLENPRFPEAVEIAKSWTSQSGFPLIKIAEWKQLKETRVFLLTQEPFTEKFNEDKRELKAFRWYIPLEFVTSKDPKKTYKTTLMKSNILEVSISGIQKGDWVKIRSVGYFRVGYPPSLMQDFISATKSKQMAPVDRLGLLDDMFHLCRCGEAATTDVLQLLKAYRLEPNYYVLETISQVLKSFNLLFQFTQFHDKFQEFGVSILTKAYHRLKFDASTKEGCLERQLRATILLRLAELNDKNVIEEGMQRFDKCLDSTELYLKPVLYSIAVTKGSEEQFQELLNMSKVAAPDVEAQILRALGYTKSEVSTSLLFDHILSGSMTQLAITTALYSLCSSRFGLEKVWSFFRTNVSFFRETLGESRLMHVLVKRMIEGFCESQMAVEIEEFFYDSRLEYLDETVKNSIESIRIREAWLARDGPDVEQYLTQETTNLIVID